MLTVAIAAIALTATRQNPAKDTGLLGLQLNVTVNGGVKELFESAQEERDMGCRAIPFSIKWKDLEPSPGQFDLDKLKSEFAWRERFGFFSYLTLQTIDTNQRTVPSDLTGEPWNSNRMLSRETALFRAIAKVLPKTVRAVMLGNEVDAYLTAHRDELSSYLSFLKAGREAIRSELPAMPVGVTTMFMSLRSDTRLVEQLQAPMDIVAMTYYPLQGMAMVRPPSEVGGDFDQMLAIAGRRLLFLQEAGVPASPIVGSSEDLQAEFVNRLFDAMEKHRTRIAAVCYFLEVDFSDKLIDQLVGYYQVGLPEFRAFLATLGLKKQDGTPRKAWGVFRARAKQFSKG